MADANAAVEKASRRSISSLDGHVMLELILLVHAVGSVDYASQLGCRQCVKVFTQTGGDVAFLWQFAVDRVARVLDVGRSHATVRLCRPGILLSSLLRLVNKSLGKLVEKVQ